MREMEAIRAEVLEAAERIWFVQAVEDLSDSENTLTMRLIIRSGLFTQVFLGGKSGSFYMALIEGRQRVFGVDREAGVWHEHPYLAADKHEQVSDDFSQKPVLRFLAKVEELILTHDLL